MCHQLSVSVQALCIGLSVTCEGRCVYVCVCVLGEVYPSVNSEGRYVCVLGEVYL